MMRVIRSTPVSGFEFGSGNRLQKIRGDAFSPETKNNIFEGSNFREEHQCSN